MRAVAVAKHETRPHRARHGMLQLCTPLCQTLHGMAASHWLVPKKQDKPRLRRGDAGVEPAPTQSGGV
jgi:hypothetical protein